MPVYIVPGREIYLPLKSCINIGTDYLIYASINSSGAHSPPPSRATVGHLLKLSVPGVGHSQFSLGISLPRGDPLAFDARVFELTWKSLSEKTRPSLKTGLSVTDSKYLWMLLKVCFLSFRYFFIYTCKHMNI